MTHRRPNLTHALFSPRTLSSILYAYISLLCVWTERDIDKYLGERNRYKDSEYFIGLLLPTRLSGMHRMLVKFGARQLQLSFTSDEPVVYVCMCVCVSKASH